MILKTITGGNGTGIETSAEEQMNDRTKAFLLIAARTLLWLCLVASPFVLHGQSTNPAPIYPPNRYLLVVETSRSMQRRAEPMVKAVKELLRTGVGGQARRGDTLGVWTFNEEVYQGYFSLQKWSADTQKSIADRVAGFLRAQKFEKRGRIEKVGPALDRLVSNSPFLTVILVCMGEEDIHGTPYDQRINEFFKTWRLQEQDAGTPFVIALRAQGGRFVDCSLNPSPWPAELPALPKELLTPLVAAAPQVTQPRKPPVSTVPPLIISGKKPQPAAAITNAMPAEPLSQPANPAVGTASVQSPSSSLANTPAPDGKPATVSAAETGIASTPVASDRTDSSGSPKPVTPQQSADGGLIPSPKSPVLPPPETVAQPIVKTVAPEPSSAGSSSALAANRPDQASGLTSAESKLVKPPAPGPESSSTVAPVSEAVAAPSTAQAHLGIYWLGGLVSISVALAAVWLVWRRHSRSSGEGSLITESIDRHKR